MKIALKSGLAALSLLASLVGVGASAAPAYPSKPIRLIVPYPAGGSTDVLARMLGQKVGESLGQTVIVENRPGANGAIARSAADAPEIDGVVHIANGQLLKPGQFVDVLVESADEHDLHARLAG